MMVLDFLFEGNHGKEDGTGKVGVDGRAAVFAHGIGGFSHCTDAGGKSVPQY
jgi:hypothetical protein